MGSYRKHNLKIKSQSLGQVFIEPRVADVKDIESAKIVVYPAPFDTQWMPAIVEWAASTQVPFFCHVQEIKKLKGEGFGAYRFQKLDTFKEVDFLAGAIEFFPSRSKKHGGLRGWVQELREVLGVREVPGFHMIIKPRREQHVLFLSHPFVDHIEWSLLTKGNPLAIVGSDHHSREAWQKLSQRFRAPIFYSQDIECIDTQQGVVEFSPDAEVKSFSRINQNVEEKTGDIVEVL